MAIYKSDAEPSSSALQKEVGSRLARIRLSRNITQATLAEDAGIALRTLGRMEQGQSSNLDSFLRVVASLGFARDFLDAFPSHEFSPIERMDTRKKTRKRARPDQSGPADEPWAWGDP